MIWYARLSSHQTFGVVISALHEKLGCPYLQGRSDSRGEIVIVDMRRVPLWIRKEWVKCTQCHRVQRKKTKPVRPMRIVALPWWKSLAAHTLQRPIRKLRD